MNQKVVDKIFDNNTPSSLSSMMRFQRFSVFLKYLGVSDTHSILDVGGTVDTWINTGYEGNVTILNLSFPNKVENESGFNCIRGDALNMTMFEDSSFDIVYSNSVIEHVCSFENQRTFAKEIQRVGKAYWVQTPNRYFPIEPHFIFPFFQFLPLSIQKRIAVSWKYSHVKKWKNDNESIINGLSEIRLLNRKELLTLFKGASLYQENVFGLTKSLVAYKC